MKIPNPCEVELKRYHEIWETNEKYEKYRVQEEILENFFNQFTTNTTLHSILPKVTLLNSFYSTGILDVYTVAKHIHSLNIDAQLENNELSLIDKIRHVKMHKDFDFYSFATKYCSFHKPDIFPIYDSSVSEALWDLKNEDEFCSFKKTDLKDYKIFCAVLKVFQKHYKLDKFSLKEIDRYLWTFKKENPKVGNTIMLYKQKFDTFIRQYDDIGYICSKADFGDRIVDTVGAMFLNALSREGQSLEILVEKIAKNFVDADIDTLTQDAKEFYAMLEADGFIVSGETEEELSKKDTHFTYNTLAPKTIKEDFTPIIQRATKSTQEYLDKHFAGKPHLTSLQIELTSKCNERCVHCYIPHENKITDITPELYYSVLEQCKEMGLLTLTLSGGEPMLHKNFLDFLRKAQEYDFSVNILTNLTLLTDEIVEEMKKNRLSSVQVSLYSMNPAIHDEITQMKGSFEKTKNAILKLVENDIPLQISCPTMKQNKNCYVDVINWAKKLKVRAVSDYIMMAKYDHTTDNLDNRLSLK